MELTEEQKAEWDKWLSERPDNVKKVANKIVPWKRYKDKRNETDIGNRYVPRSYDEEENGKVTLTCEKVNDEMPLLGGYGVFGIDPESLEEE
jgi:hypothetical protein